MLWPEPRVRQPRNVALRARVDAARQRSPEAAPWLALVEAAMAEGDRGAWQTAVPEPAPDRSVKAPLLSHTAPVVDRGTLRSWVRRLLTQVPRGHAPRIDAVSLLEAGVCQDDARLKSRSALTAADVEQLRVAAQIAALPLLQASGRALAGAVPQSWWEAYCPVCGAWPTLAEYSGLERKRQLRCGRCGTAWGIPALRCVFCDETSHEQLGYLTLEGGDDEARKIEVCNTCNGYLKASTTVHPLAPWAVLLDDCSSVHLDIAALERGYERPTRPPYSLDVRIVEHRGPLLGLLLRPRSTRT